MPLCRCRSLFFPLREARTEREKKSKEGKSSTLSYFSLTFFSVQGACVYTGRDNNERVYCKLSRLYRKPSLFTSLIFADFFAALFSLSRSLMVRATFLHNFAGAAAAADDDFCSSRMRSIFEKSPFFFLAAAFDSIQLHPRKNSLFCDEKPTLFVFSRFPFTRRR
jgi:hypothetical protein